MAALKIPKTLASCTHLEIDPPGGQRWVMLFNLLQHDYDRLPRVMVFLKDTFRNTIYKSNKRNEASFIKKFHPVLVPGVPIPIPKLLKQIAANNNNTPTVGFQHLTQRVNWHTSGFIEKFNDQGQIFKDLYSFFLCQQAPDTGWPAIPGGLVAVERARIRRLPREAYQELRSILLQMKDKTSAPTAAVGMEHTIAAMFGCAGPNIHPKCPPLARNITFGQEVLVVAAEPEASAPHGISAEALSVRMKETLPGVESLRNSEPSTSDPSATRDEKNLSLASGDGEGYLKGKDDEDDGEFDEDREDSDDSSVVSSGRTTSSHFPLRSNLRMVVALMTYVVYYVTRR
jgi:hypothetical protein